MGGLVDCRCPEAPADQDFGAALTSSMYFPFFSYLLALLSLSFLSSTTATEPQTQTLTLHARPVAATPASYKPFAVLSYTPSSPQTGKLLSLTTPANTTSHTSIAVIDSPSSIRSTITLTKHFHEPYTGHFRIHLASDGKDVLSASWVSYLGSKLEGEGGVEVIPQTEHPGIFMESAQPVQGQGGILGGLGVGMPEKVSEEGDVQEKTFLQKYWWVLAAALVVSLIGPGGDK